MMTNDLEDSDAGIGTLDEYLHVKIGSKQPHQTFKSVKLVNAGNSAFKCFRIKVNNFLNFTPNGRALLDGQKVQLNAKDEVYTINRLKDNSASH